MAKRSVDDDDKFVMHHYKNDKGETLTQRTNLLEQLLLTLITNILKTRNYLK